MQNIEREGSLTRRYADRAKSQGFNDSIIEYFQKTPLKDRKIVEIIRTESLPDHMSLHVDERMLTEAEFVNITS
ncbi:hypothetical protein SprV_0100025500 [Sparganum proliferum]